MKPMGIPVIFLTAKGSVNDRIKGLRLGADDYIVKPFQVGELVARVEAVLRRYGKGIRKLTFANVEIDLFSRVVLKNGQPVDLTVKEFDLLVELMGDTRTLDSHIQRLRKKLGWEKCIKTVFRIGYRLEEEG